MKFVQVSFLLGVVALAAASPLHYLYGHGGHDEHSDGHHYEHHNYAPAHYKYEYGVHDPHTGDIKEAKESGDGHGGVKGYYKLKEADGTIRIVHYTADKHNGFQAHVEKIGHAHHPVEHHHVNHHSHHHDHHEHIPVYYEHHEPLVYHHYEHVPQIEEYHHHYEPVHHSYNWPYAYGYASHYGHAAEHDFHVYHDKHHAKSHQSVTMGHHH